MYWRQRIVNQLVINWRQLAPAIEQLTFNSPLAPINWMDWRQSNWLPIEWQLNDNWTFNELASIEWQLASIVNQFIELLNSLNYSIGVNWMFTFNWRQLMYNWIQWLPIDANWRQLNFNWMSFFSIEWYWRQLMFNPRAFNWTSIDFNWIENHSIQWQLNSIEWYYSIKRCRENSPTWNCIKRLKCSETELLGTRGAWFI